VVSGGQVLCPGPGHSAKDRSLSITPDDAAPGGFLAHSFAGDDPIVCKDFARQKLGLEPFKPNGEGRPRPPFPPKGEGLDFTIGERISMDETISLDDWEDVRAMIERKRAETMEPFDPADLDYFPPGEPRPNRPDAQAPRKSPSRVIGAGTFMRSYAPISAIRLFVRAHGKARERQDSLENRRNYRSRNEPAERHRVGCRTRTRGLCLNRKSDRLQNEVGR
jgi:hypothetical protein